MSVPKKKPTIVDTPKGVRVDVKAIYAYDSGMTHIVFADGTEWPMADDLEAIAWIAEHLLKPMKQRARRVAKSAGSQPTQGTAKGGSGVTG